MRATIYTREAHAGPQAARDVEGTVEELRAWRDEAQGEGPCDCCCGALRVILAGRQLSGAATACVLDPACAAGDRCHVDRCPAAGKCPLDALDEVQRAELEAAWTAPAPGAGLHRAQAVLDALGRRRGPR